MLSVAGEHLASHNPNARLVVYGQELNAESYAICKADMLIKRKCLPRPVVTA
jgi:type I restriction enzyme M protein